MDKNTYHIHSAKSIVKSFSLVLDWRNSLRSLDLTLDLGTQEQRFVLFLWPERPEAQLEMGRNNWSSATTVCIHKNTNLSCHEYKAIKDMLRLLTSCRSVRWTYQCEAEDVSLFSSEQQGQTTSQFSQQKSEKHWLRNWCGDKFSKKKCEQHMTSMGAQLIVCWFKSGAGKVFVVVKDNCLSSAVKNDTCFKHRHQPQWKLLIN